MLARASSSVSDDLKPVVPRPEQLAVLSDCLTDADPDYHAEALEALKAGKRGFFRNYGTDFNGSPGVVTIDARNPRDERIESLVIPHTVSACRYWSSSAGRRCCAPRRRCRECRAGARVPGWAG